MTLTLAIIGNLVGDYLLQNDWMSMNKKKHTFHCAVHCTLWTLAVCAFTGWWNIAAICFLWVTHFAVDRTYIVIWWMRLIGQERFMRSDDFDMTDMEVIPGLGPWSIIVVDNVWHIVSLWVVWRFL